MDGGPSIQHRGCRFVPEKPFRKQSATDFGTKKDLNMGVSPRFFLRLDETDQIYKPEHHRWFSCGVLVPLPFVGS